VELKNKILEEYKKGNIVYSTITGLAVARLEDFIEQSTEGMLYSLNRLPEVVLTFLDDPKWVNDYAVAVVIAKLKEKVTMLCDECPGEQCINFPMECSRCCHGADCFAQRAGDKI